MQQVLKTLHTVEVNHVFTPEVVNTRTTSSAVVRVRFMIVGVIDGYLSFHDCGDLVYPK